MNPLENMEPSAESVIPDPIENSMGGSVESVEFPRNGQAIDSTILKNLEEVQQGSDNDSISPEALEQLRQLQSDKPDETGGIVREFIDMVQDKLEEVKDNVLDFFGFDTDKGSDFDPAAFRESIESGAAEWHEQLEPYSCAIASQHFIISEYTDAPVTEQELIQAAAEMGWYEELGTPMADVGNLLMAYGIDVTIKMEGSFDDLLEASANGNRVLVSVQNMAMTTEWADGYPAYSANHIVEVLDIDNSDPENPRIIVNDPGIPNGQAMSMTRENFEDAWMTGGGYMCVAHRPEGN